MPLEKTFLDFKKWVKSVQIAGYNGASTVYFFHKPELKRAATQKREKIALDIFSVQLELTVLNQ